MSGWMPDVEHIPTQQFGYSSIPADTMKPLAIMSHIMQGYQRTMINWATNGSGRVSAHFTIGRDGKIAQHVSIYDPAWHAGRVESPTWPLYTGGNPNHYTVGIEHEGFSQVPNYGYDYIYDENNPWPEPMVESAIEIHKWFFEETKLKPSKLTIIGHRETATRSRLNDPGEMWPQQRILDSFDGESAHEILSRIKLDIIKLEGTL